MYKRLLGIAVATFLALTPVVPAQAFYREADCFADGDWLMTDTFYVKSGNYWYVDYMLFIIQWNDSHQNNVKLRVIGAANGRYYYSWNSGDDIWGSSSYRVDPNVYVPLTANGYVRNWMSADQAFDSECWTGYAYLSSPNSLQADQYAKARPRVLRPHAVRTS